MVVRGEMLDDGDCRLFALFKGGLEKVDSLGAIAQACQARGLGDLYNSIRKA
jgi:hypothetical protein